MSAGLPGVGLGGLFFICSALLAPWIELVRTLQGRSSRERWARVARQFTMAVAMVLAIQVTLVLVRVLLGVPILRLSGVSLITLALLGTVVAGAKLTALGARQRRRSREAKRIRTEEWALLGSNQ